MSQVTAGSRDKIKIWWTLQLCTAVHTLLGRSERVHCGWPCSQPQKNLISSILPGPGVEGRVFLSSGVLRHLYGCCPKNHIWKSTQTKINLEAFTKASFQRAHILAPSVPAPLPRYESWQLHPLRHVPCRDCTFSCQNLGRPSERWLPVNIHTCLD